MHTPANPSAAPGTSLLKRLVTRLALLALLGLNAGGAPAAPTAAASLSDAQRAYYQGQYSRSLALFENLAATRNTDAAEAAEAAECAGFMLLHGEPLYGPQVRRNLPRAKALLLQAARAGRPSAGFMLNMLERTD